MTHIKVRNVQQALSEGFWNMRLITDRQQSRNGEVLVYPGPVLTEYEYPMERVLFHPRRDANPVFHLMESIWMLAGSNDVNWLLPFNSQFGKYAEDDGRVWGAYGYRWRRHFAIDQIAGIIEELSAHRDSRRAVMSMWSPQHDLGRDKRDLPCNTHIYFDLIGNRLNMTVCCRSNDMLWGAYGANAVHMSVLQELIAHALFVEMGVYRQFSNNFHLYTDNAMVQDLLGTPPYYEFGDDPYNSKVCWVPLVSGDEDWEDFVIDCQALVAGDIFFRTAFFHTVVRPLQHLYLRRKTGEVVVVPNYLKQTDWGLAFHEWVERRNDIQA